MVGNRDFMILKNTEKWVREWQTVGDCKHLPEFKISAIKEKDYDHRFLGGWKNTAKKAQ